MFIILEKAVLGMALLRIISGSIEIFVALLMIRFNDIEKAMLANSALAFVGPTVLILTTMIGLVGLSDKISFTKMLWIVIGVGCILYGVKSGN